MGVQLNTHMDDLGVSLVFFFNEDARLGFGLLKYEIFRSKSQSVRLYSLKK